MAKIVVVDDASFMRGSLKFILETAGHQIVGMGKDGAEAEQLYKELMPDLMTMDILMKGEDGLTALKNIRRDHPEARIVIVTALGQETKEAEAHDLGAAGYIRKPFKQKEIVDTVAAVLAG